MSSPTTPPRRRDELLELLEQRRRAFHQQPPHIQQTINRDRVLSVEELHGILDHYLTFGHCADETINTLGHAYLTRRHAA